MIADAAIPLDNMNIPVRMQVSTGKQVVDCSHTEISGIISNGNAHISTTTERMPESYIKGSRGLLGSEVSLSGTVYFTFPTTKTPDAIMVYNKDNKSIKFDVKSVKTK